MPDVIALPVEPVALRAVKPPAKQAMVLICRRCERRVEKGGDAGHRLARRLRKLSRALFGKGSVRTVFTPCMSLCPRDAIAVAVVRGGKGSAPGGAMYIANASQPKKAAQELLDTLQSK